MDLSPLPEALRTKIEKKVQKKPELAAIVRIVMAKHGAEPEKTEALLAQMVKPNVWPAVGVTVAIAAPLLGLGAIFYDQQQTEAAIANGISTTARVEVMKSGNCVIGTKGSKCLELKLRVFPSGGAAYDGELTEVIPLEWMSRVQPGSWLIVAVDKNDPQKLTLDEHAFERPAPAAVTE